MESFIGHLSVVDHVTTSTAETLLVSPVRQSGNQHVSSCSKLSKVNGSSSVVDWGDIWTTRSAVAKTAVTSPLVPSAPPQDLAPIVWSATHFVTGPKSANVAPPSSAPKAKSSIIGRASVIVPLGARRTEQETVSESKSLSIAIII